MFTVPAWKQAPFIRIIPFFIAGIVVEWHLHFNFILLISLSISALILFLLPGFFSVSRKYMYRKVRGFTLCSLLFYSGSFTAWNARPGNDKEWFGHYLGNNPAMIITVDEVPVEKNRSWKANGKVSHLLNGTVKHATGKIILYFSKKDTLIPHYGDQLLLSKKVALVSSSGNPGSFDYSRYLALQGIHHQVFIEGEDYIIVGSEVSVFIKFIHRSREYALDVLKKFVPGKIVAGVAEALMIGYKEDLDRDLVQAYSNAGVVHIIAISGLHLGLIYMLITLVVSRIPVLNKKRIPQYLIILTSLWYFTFITGCPASAFRSAVMFSLILTGKTFFRQHSTYNAISASAVFLLCADPLLLWDVGFQLSYIAVTGIVWLQAPLYRLLFFKNTLISKVWSLVCVTLAAQLITTPLCIYYFHQFPNLFLITNLVSVPLSSAILITGMFLFSVSWIPFAAAITGQVVSWMIRLLNGFVQRINEWPSAVTNQLNNDLFFTCIFYAMIISFCLCFLFGKKKYLFHGSIFLILLLAINFYHTYNTLQQNKFIVYNIPGSRAYDFIHQQASSLMCDSIVKVPGPANSMNIIPSRTWFNIKSTTVAEPPAATVFGNTLFFFPEPGVRINNTAGISPDVIIVSRNSFNAEQFAFLKPSLIVFDASNSLWKIEKWISDCERLNLPFYSVPHKGALILDL